MTLGLAGILTGLAAGLVWLLLTIRGHLVFTSAPWNNPTVFLAGGLFSRGQTLFAFAVALVSGVIVSLWTTTIMLGVATGLVAVAIPYMGKRRVWQRRELARLDGVAAFAMTIAQSVGGGKALATAVTLAASRPPRSLSSELGNLKANLEGRDFPVAVVQLAHDIDNSAANRLTAHLLQAEAYATSGLQANLTKAAESVQAHVKATHQIRSSRYKKEFEIRIITLVLVLLVLFLTLASPDLLAVYSNGVMGELKMAVVIGLAFGGWGIAERESGNLSLAEFELNSSSFIDQRSGLAASGPQPYLAEPHQKAERMSPK